MAYVLSNLLRDAMRFQGQDAFDIRVATSGSTTTMIDTMIEDKYSEDEYKDGTIIVIRTTDSAAPQDEFSRISAYSENTMEATFAALTAVVDANDACMLISNEYPLRVLIELANDALRDCGEISLTSTSLTTVDGAREYTLPVAEKNLVGVYLQTNLNDTDDNSWVRLDSWRIVPSAGNVDATIIFPQTFLAGYLLQFIYNTFHPDVSVYNSPINEAIPAPLIALVLADKIMQWSGVSNANINYANKIQAELQQARGKYRVRKERAKTQFFTFPKSV